MIPPLVALIALGQDQKLCEQVLARVRDRTLGSTEDLLQREPLGSLEHLPPPPVRRLVPKEPASGIFSELLDALVPEALLPGLSRQPDGLSVKAGLYQMHDYLDISHSLAQQADDLGPNSTAAYWHAIMHRREPDYSNARYWFRRVGQHAIFPQVGHEVAGLLEHDQFRRRIGGARLLDRHGHWDAMAFVDLCQRCGPAWDQRAQAAAKLQSIEMRVLLEYSCSAALGTV